MGVFDSCALHSRSIFSLNCCTCVGRFRERSIVSSTWQPSFLRAD